MAHFLGISTHRPNAVQKRKLTLGLRNIDSDLLMCIGAKGQNEADFYVQAPDYYGASHMQEKAAQVRALVKSVLGE